MHRQEHSLTISWLWLDLDVQHIWYMCMCASAGLRPAERSILRPSDAKAGGIRLRSIVYSCGRRSRGRQGLPSLSSTSYSADDGRWLDVLLQVIAVVLYLPFVDKLGRKAMLITGSVVMAISLFVLAGVNWDLTHDTRYNNFLFGVSVSYISLPVLYPMWIALMMEVNAISLVCGYNMGNNLSH